MSLTFTPFELWLILALWLLIGFASFAFWWAESGSMTFEGFVLALLISTHGPVAFLIGWLMIRRVKGTTPQWASGANWTTPDRPRKGDRK